MISHLDDTAVPLLGRYQEFPLPWAVSTRFLEVDVFSRLEGQEGCGGVPVVRRGDNQGMDRLVVQGSAEV